MSSIVPVQVGRHAPLRWRRYTSYAFAAARGIVPVVLAELPHVVSCFAIAFVRQGEGFVPMAVLGFEPTRNLFVGGDGRWLAPYVPAALRGHPFALGRMENGELVLCIDESSGLVVEGAAGERFFADDGATPSAEMRQVFDFLQGVEQNGNLTLAATAALQAANLIQPWPITLHGEQGERKVEGLFRIDERALVGLDDPAFLKLRAPGALPLAYAQLLSMQNLGALRRLASLRTQPVPQPPTMPLGQDLDLSFLENGGTLKLG